MRPTSAIIPTGQTIGHLSEWAVVCSFSFLNHGVFKMTAKKTAIAYAIDSTPVSFKDAGYKAARAGESLRAVAQYLLDTAEGFYDNPVVNDHKELRADLAEGYKLRAHELWGIDHYVISKDTQQWLPIGNSVKTANMEKILAEHSEAKREIRQINVHYVTAMSTNEFTQLKKRDPIEGDLVDKMRAKFRKYELDCNSAIMRKISEILAEAKGDKKTREMVLFTDALKKSFEAFEKSVKVKQTRGDATADPVKFAVALNKFWETYNK